MNSEKYEKSIEILEIKDPEFTVETLKRQYRKMALRYHPDKNHSNANERFLEVQAAYEFLMEDLDSDIELVDETDQMSFNDSEIFSNIKTKVDTYKDYLFSFFKPILGEYALDQIQNQLFHMILHRIMNKCEEKAIIILERMDKRVIKKIYEILLENRDIIQYSDQFLNNMTAIIENKTKHDECIVLHPKIDDIFNDNVYKLTDKNITYAIPLWHNELVYDQSGSDLYVHCVPILPDNIEIDEKNNIHIHVQFCVSVIIDKDKLEINIGSRIFYIDRSSLSLARKQTVTLTGQGISKINVDNIFDVSKRANIYVCVEMSV